MLCHSNPVTTLIVEDDAVLGRVLERVLTCDGRTTALHVRESGQAMRVLKQHAPRLVLLDACLRAGTAFQLVDAICRNHPELPVILLTAHWFDQSRLPALRAPGGDQINRLAGIAPYGRGRSCRRSSPKAKPTPLETTLAASRTNPLATAKSAHHKGSQMPILPAQGVKILAATLLALLAPTQRIASGGAARLPPSPRQEGSQVVAASSPNQPVKLVEEPPQTIVISEDVKIFGIRMLALLATVGLTAASVAARLRWSHNAAGRPAPVARTSRAAVEHSDTKLYRGFVRGDVRNALGIRESSTE